MAWFTCVSYYYFLYVVIYAPRLKDFVLSLGGFVVVVVVVLFLFFCLTCKEKFCPGHSLFFYCLTCKEKFCLGHSWEF